MKNVFFMLAASLIITAAANAQTTIKTEKQTTKKELHQVGDKKAAEKQTKEVSVTKKESRVAGRHGNKVVAKTNKVATHSQTNAVPGKTDAAKQTKEIKTDNKSMHKDVVSVKKEDVKHQPKTATQK